MHEIVVVGAVIAAWLMATADMGASPQRGRWASETDPIAKNIIDMERQWAEAGCTHQPVAKDFIADDFQGTAPSGKRYDKAQALQTDQSLRERDCRLDEAKVRFFGDSVAVAYGSERALRMTTEDGKESMRCLVWTDTWLKRGGKWEIVAAQDTDVPCMQLGTGNEMEAVRKAFEGIVAFSQNLSGWALLIAGGSIVTIVGTSYYRPHQAWARLIYVIFIPGWSLLGRSMYYGVQVQRSNLGYLFSKPGTDLSKYKSAINDDALNQIVAFQHAMYCFGAWLVLYLVWWLLADIRAEHGGKS